MSRNTTAIGQGAESEAVAWLEGHGFEIVARNWKTRWCEIDIVARRCRRGLRRHCSMHFVEVKYRSLRFSGEAIEYVTRAKQQQMIKAAESWLIQHTWDGAWQLDVIAIDGKTSELNYIQNITQ